MPVILPSGDNPLSASEIFSIAPAVQEALSAGRPVVALESALISHGLPYPLNLETAQAMEAAIRAEGALPATIGLIAGQVVVGLSTAQCERLARGQGVRKVSRRDLPLALAWGMDGGTTVAATVYLAGRCGLRVMATGGIGGVHRGQPHDISADLPELARTPLVVVCSGPKALLDLPLTREVLETYGVPVIGYGVEEMPAFISVTSGLPVDGRVDAPEEVARLVRARDALGLMTALLVTVPAPAEVALSPEEAQAATTRALQLAQERRITGAALTPFVLAQMDALTSGRSRQANIALLVNNARVAARIARALAGT
ncbi:MAG: pseudouridine-5-phosphate glycosidase [Chloroflexota bacterium]